MLLLLQLLAGPNLCNSTSNPCAVDYYFCGTGVAAYGIGQHSVDLSTYRWSCGSDVLSNSDSSPVKLPTAFGGSCYTSLSQCLNGARSS